MKSHVCTLVPLWTVAMTEKEFVLGNLMKLIMHHISRMVQSSAARRYCTTVWFSVDPIPTANTRFVLKRFLVLIKLCPSVWSMKHHFLLCEVKRTQIRQQNAAVGFWKEMRCNSCFLFFFAVRSIKRVWAFHRSLSLDIKPTQTQQLRATL